MSAQSFLFSVKQWLTGANTKLDKLARQCCMEISERVVERTPVDTGFLRGSWQPSIGKPEDAKGDLDPGGALALSRISFVVTDVKVGDHFFMINNAAYARFVEHGTSKMAGRHFVSQTVKEWPSIVSQVARELKVTK